MTKMSTERGGKLKSPKKPVKKRAPAKPRPPVPIRIFPDMVDRIDDVRDPLIPREPYVRWLIELGLDQVEDDSENAA